MPSRNGIGNVFTVPGQQEIHSMAGRKGNMKCVGCRFCRYGMTFYLSVLVPNFPLLVLYEELQSRRLPPNATRWLKRLPVQFHCEQDPKYQMEILAARFPPLPRCLLIPPNRHIAAWAACQKTDDTGFNVNSRFCHGVTPPSSFRRL